MEYALEGRRQRANSQRQRQVLILVLMEYALEVTRRYDDADRVGVLILVLMEYALEGRWAKRREYEDFKS